MRQASFAQFTCVSIDVSNLLEARMIITSYNQHVRLLSSEPFGWFAPPKFTRPWEPTLFMESLRLLTPQRIEGCLDQNPVPTKSNRLKRFRVKIKALEELVFHR